MFPTPSSRMTTARGAPNGLTTDEILAEHPYRSRERCEACAPILGPRGRAAAPLGLAGDRDGRGRLGAAGEPRPGEPGNAPCGCRARDQFHGDLARPAAQSLVVDDQAEQRPAHRLHDRERGRNAASPAAR